MMLTGKVVQGLSFFLNVSADRKLNTTEKPLSCNFTALIESMNVSAPADSKGTLQIQKIFSQLKVTTAQCRFVPPTDQTSKSSEVLKGKAATWKHRAVVFSQLCFV